jgi:hypothetical protein
MGVAINGLAAMNEELSGVQATSFLVGVIVGLFAAAIIGIR